MSGKRILSFALILVLLLVSAGCGAKSSTDQAKEALTSMLSALKKADFQGMVSQISKDATLDLNEEEAAGLKDPAVQAMLDRTKFSFVSGEIEDAATAGSLLYKVEAVNLFSMEGMSLGDSPDAAAVKALPLATYDFEVTYVKEGDAWKISNPSEVFMMAMGMGGMMAAFENLGNIGEGMGEPMEPAVDAASPADSSEAPSQAEPATPIELGVPFVVGNYEVTLHSLEKVDTWDDEEEALKMVYGWKNNSDAETMAIMAIDIRGYQNGVELEGTVLSDSIDLGIGQKNVQPGYGQDNCETGVIIEEEGPIEIRVKELFTFSDNFFFLTVDPVGL